MQVMAFICVGCQMLEFEFEMYDVHRIRILPPSKPELASDEGGADTAGQAADRVHRRSRDRMWRKLHFSDSRTSRIAEVRRRADTYALTVGRFGGWTRML